MAFIRKHASFLALLAALAGLVAAPYLIPENPDSAIFRSGLFGTLLVMACYMPVKEALQRADRRTLACALGFGLMLGCALSLGSELFVYDGLLPGMGSMIRRLAVPVLAAPLLGGLAARLMSVSVPSDRVRRFPWWSYALVVFICWLPLLLAYFPAMLNYDFVGQYAQHTTGQYTNLHPLLHSVLCNGVITLGERLHSQNFGLLLMSLLQMSLFAAALGYSCHFAQRRGAPVWLLLALTALYACFPVFSVMALSMTKDTLFAAAALVLSLLTWEALEQPADFWADRRKRLLFVICAVGTALLRNNGVFVLIPLMLALIAASRGTRRRIAALCGASLATIVLVFIALTALFTPKSMPSFQLYSLPAQQLVRAYHVGEITPEEKAELTSWYLSPDWGMRLLPHLADSAKGSLDAQRLAEHGDDFLDLWLRVGKKNPRVYLEALLMLNIGSWYPDDVTHADIYSASEWSDKGYLQTHEGDTADMHVASYLPKVTQFYERICRYNAYQKYPILSLLFCPAAPFWGVIFACALLCAKRRARLLPALIGVLGLWLSYQLGPCTLARYALPLFCLAPTALACAFLLPHFLSERV